MVSDNSRLAVLEKTTEIQEDRINSLDHSIATLATEFRESIKELVEQLSNTNSILSNMKGFWAGIAFSMSIIGAGAMLIFDKIIGKLWP